MVYLRRVYYIFDAHVVYVHAIRKASPLVSMHFPLTSLVDGVPERRFSPYVKLTHRPGRSFPRRTTFPPRFRIVRCTHDAFYRRHSATPSVVSDFTADLRPVDAFSFSCCSQKKDNYRTVNIVTN